MYWKEAQTIIIIIVWLALWAGKMNQIPYCAWLPKQARWSNTACFCSHNNILLKFKQVHENFLSQNIFYDSKQFSMTVKAFLWFLCQVELENKKTKVSTRIKTKMLMSFKTVYLFQQKPVNKKVKAQSNVECHIINPLLTKLAQSR